jgi:hypothetical protein
VVDGVSPRDRRVRQLSRPDAVPLFSYPGEPRWDEAAEAVVFEVELGDYHGSVFVPRRVFHDRIGHRPTPEQCVEYFHLHRIIFEKIAEAKLRARELGEDANVHILGRDLRREPTTRM